jgi:signal transduction histidine kinase
VAHELNTPIGNALTSASTLQDRLQDITRSAADGQLRKSTLSDFLSDGSAIAELITRSCERAANLVSSFKQVAVDQTSEQRRQFDLRALVDDIVTTLRPTLKHLPWHITIEVPSGLHCDSYPGPLGQVISNLIQNAMLHAFTGRHQGNLRISASARSNGEIEMSFDDNGIGMSPAILARIFDPFFTTRLGSGGSGLGLSVSHNIAIGVLSGSLSARSHLGQGSSFILTFAAHAAATPT